MRRCFRPGLSGRPEDSRFRFWSEKNDSGQEDEPVEGRMEWYESTGNRPYGSVGEGVGRMRCTETCDLVSAHTVRRPSPRIFSGRKMCLSLRSRRHWGMARLRLRCAICVWAWRKTLRFSPGAAASDCLPGLTTDRISGISSYKSSYTKEKALNISAFSCPRQESNLHALRHTHLKRARLPIPPPGRYRSFPELRCAKVILFFELPTLFCEKNYLLKNLY